MLGYVVYLMIKEMGHIKPTFIAMLPSLFILLESFCDNTHRCYNITYFIFAFMILFMDQNKSVGGNYKTQTLKGDYFI